jgi:hypothetical protein
VRRADENAEASLAPAPDRGEPVGKDPIML